MSLRKPIVFATALFLAASTGFAFQTPAPSLTGTWTGTFTSTTSTGEPDEDPAYLVLKQTGEELTGTGGPRADRQMPVHRLREIGVDGRQLDQGPLRRAQHRRLVRRIEQRGLALPKGLGVGGQGR